MSIDHRQTHLPLIEFQSPWETKGIFSDHYLRTRVRESILWPKEENVIPTWKFCKDLWDRRYIGLARGNEAVTRQELIEPVLKQLGFTFLPNTRLPVGKQQQEPDYILFADEKTKDSVFEKGKLEQYEAAISLVEVKSVNHALSTVSKIETPGRFPHQQVRDYLQSATDDTGKPFFNWAILTNGNRWRLYCRDAHPGDYFELNFEDSIHSLSDFTTFYALFRPAAFVKNGDGRCALDDLREESLQVQTKLEDDLRKRVFNILTDLANGFYKRKENNINENDLVVLYDNCLIFLYRLLFVLYAEGRGLLPVKSRGIGSNKHYRNRYSIAALIPKLKSRLNYDSDDFTDLYNRLLGLFHLINGDQPSRNKACQVPQYNGGLFNHKQHPLIEKWQVGERTLSDVLRGLIFSNIPVAPGETLKFDFGETIDYADLEVRQLGSIYEGLLENRLELEGNHLVLVGDRSNRKATGTYYTPDYIVKYIVEKTLQPLCEKIEKLTNVQKAKGKGAEDNSFADEVLKLNVLDPAMGSGHFLVRATEFLADQIVYHPTTKLKIEEVPRGLSHEEAEISYWRRRVVESCIYGVDLNPLAVELAKLSLWLTCIAVKQPLSFLDHHLRPGNSLIGANLSELGRLPDKKKNNQIAFSFGLDLTEAVSDSIMALTEIEQMETVDVLTVKDKEMLWKKKVHDRLKPYRTVADLWTSTFFGLEISDFDYQHLAQQIVINPKPRTKEAKELKKELAPHLECLSNTRTKLPFHWELEFPEVFFDEKGSPRKNTGFDAVIGNPPWGANFSGEELAYHREKNREIIVRMIDSFMYFVYQSNIHLNNNGFFGMIIPDVLLYQVDNEKLRRIIADNFSIENILNLGNRVFHKVNRPSAIIVINKSFKTENHKINVADYSELDEQELSTAILNGLKLEQILQSRVRNIPGCLFVTKNVKQYDVLEKVKKVSYKRLGDLVDDDGIQRGVSPDLKDAFIVDTKTAKREDLETHKLKKVLTGGKQVKRYYIHYSDSLLIYTKRNDNFELLPNIRRFIDQFVDQITCREVKEGKHPFYALHRPRNKNIFLKPVKLFGVITADSIVIAPDTFQTFATDGLYLFGLKNGINYKYILALLNSRLFITIYRLLTLETGRVLAQVKPTIIREIPIRNINIQNNIDKSRHDKLVDLVDRMLGFNKKLPNVEIANERKAIELEIKSTDKQIDQLVYDLYDLTKEEIKIVEGNN